MASAKLHQLPRLPVFEAIAGHDPASIVAVHSQSRKSFTYGGLLRDVAIVRDRLREATGGRDLNGKRIAFLVENGYEYIVVLLACMAARAIAVPLSPAFPPAELQYILNHSESTLLLSTAKFQTKAKKLLELDLVSKPTHLEFEPLPDVQPHACAPQVSWENGDAGSAGMMLYTSGTTSRPKGVLLPQAVLTAQCQSLQKAWSYSPSDNLLHVLPLHHIHGTVNALLAPLFAGATIEFLFPFNADAVWHRFAAPFLQSSNEASASPEDSSMQQHRTAMKPVTFFTVVPTVYSRLLSSHKSLPPAVQTAARTAISPPNLRLCISGSAALPTPIKSAWTALSHGNVLLERYGMTEVGMALSCGLPFTSRVDASVGWPLPNVEVRLVDVDTREVIEHGQELDQQGRERSGEVQLRGPTIFKEYWRNPKATASEFIDAQDGRGRWFKTGDVAIRRLVPSASASTPPASPHGSKPTPSSSTVTTKPESVDMYSSSSPFSSSSADGGSDWMQGPMYFIQGRNSADIIKTGGEKVSALEVEREILSLPQVAEAAVVAVPSGKWGQKVGAILILNQEYFNPGSDTPHQQQHQQQQQGTSEQDEGEQSSERRVKKAVKWSPLDLRRALKDRLANYKIPQVMKVVEEIPRNAMGKINKKELVKDVFAEEHSEDEL